MDALLLLVGIILPFGAIALIVWLVLTIRQLKSDVRELQTFASSIYKELRTAAQPSVEKKVELKREPPIAASVQKTPFENKVSEPAAQNAHAEINIEKNKRTLKPSLIDRLLDIRNLIWIGGIAMAFGGIFIAKYSIENGLLGPWGRMALGFLTGGIMLSVGEWLRRQPENSVKSSAWQFMPLAVAGAGFTTLYGVIFAGFALYQLFPPTVAILLMAFVAALGLGYSILLGPLLAGLALIGAYIVPALVSTETPSTEMLFLYLGLVMAGSFVLLRYRDWSWLGYANLLASAIWYGMWLVSLDVGTAEVMVVSLYFGLMLALYTYQFGERVERPFKIESATVFVGVFESAGYIIYCLFSYIAFAGVLLTYAADYEPASYFLILIPMALSVWLSNRDTLLEGTTWITHGAGLVFIALWPVSYIEGVIQIDAILVVTAMLIALFYVGVASWRIRLNDRGFLSAWHALASPILMFCLVYWKYNGFGEAPEWSLIALLIAVGYVAAAIYIRGRNVFEDQDGLVGLFAIGATAGLSLGFATILKEEWLTISFALESLAIGWIYRKITLSAFRPLAALLVIIVIVRLEMDTEVVSLLILGDTKMEWYFYGFAISILAFGIARYWFGLKKIDYLTSLLESGLILLWVTLLTLSIRDFFTDSFGTVFFSFAEGSLLGFSLLANAAGLYWLSTFSSNKVRELSWKILGTLGLIVLVVVEMISLNPLLTTHIGNVGDWYGLNWLSFGFIVPAVMLMFFHRIARPEHIKFSQILMILAGILGFLYINSEIRHVFNGDDIAIFDGLFFVGNFEQSEIYTYSISWLLYASAIMGVGIWKANRKFRVAAILLLLATVLKVFFFDTAALDGLYRAASFLGLGACLIGLAFLYQRFGKEEDVLLRNAS
ncbi:MAG: DUF2339 domain-containing protein [Sneathiella sp.]